MHEHGTKQKGEKGEEEREKTGEGRRHDEPHPTHTSQSRKNETMGRARLDASAVEMK